MTIEAIELNITQARELVERGEALNRLLDNREFKELILDGYLKKEAIRLVHLKAEPAMQTPTHQANILREMDGIGSLTGYFRQIERVAESALSAIADGEEAIEEIRLEEAAAEEGGDE
jgi:hypothetical protein